MLFPRCHSASCIPAPQELVLSPAPAAIPVLEQRVLEQVQLAAPELLVAVHPAPELLVEALALDQELLVPALEHPVVAQLVVAPERVLARPDQAQLVVATAGTRRDSLHGSNYENPFYPGSQSGK